MQLISVWWFYILQLYWLLTSSNKLFFFFCLWVFLYTNMSSTRSNNLTFFFFAIWMCFISLSWLIALAMTPSTIFNKSGESRHSCLFPSLRGKAFSFFPLSLLSVGLSSCWRLFFPYPVCWRYLSWKYFFLHEQDVF